MKRALALALLLAVAALWIAPARSDDAPTPPAQPKEGPGSSDYTHASMTEASHGEGAEMYWLFLPAEPAPEKAPVVIFLHGYGVFKAAPYTAWLQHLARRGNIVVFPRYQESMRTPPDDFTTHAAAAVNAAFALLAEGEMKPDVDRVAIVGHSAGGIVAANLAARAAELGIPAAKAVMCAEPGRSVENPNIREFLEKRFHLADYSKIPASTLLLTVAGDADGAVEDRDAKIIFEQAVALPPANRNFVLMRSDDHGKPALTADHFAPTCRRPTDDHAGPASKLSYGTPNALDYYGFWKLFDGLCDAAFYEKHKIYALGNTPEQRFMGKWSDDTPVKELEITVPKDE